MPFYTSRKYKVVTMPVVETADLSDHEWYQIFLRGADDSERVTPVAAETFEWLDASGKAHIILSASIKLLGWGRRIKNQVYPIKGTKLQLGIIVDFGNEVIHRDATVWHLDGDGRVFFLLEQTPKDVTEDSASGWVTKVNYTKLSLHTPCGFWPAGQLADWMTFKSQPTRGDTVFVLKPASRVHAYRGSLLVQTKQGSRSRIVAIVDEVYKRTQKPPPGTIDQAWKYVREAVPFCYCVARPWSAKV